MVSLYLSDILKRAGLDVNKVKLIRHALSDKGFKSCYDLGFLKEYTQIQKRGFSKGYDYWITFISDRGTSAKLEGVYKVKSVSDVPTSLQPEGFPLSDWYKPNNEFSYFDLERTCILEDLVGRLIIDWGPGTKMWHHKATTEKAVLSIQASQRMRFTGYENIILTYEELKEIIEDSTVYENWHTALSSVYAIYLITDTTNGSNYIGSAYGKGGLLSRWTCYVDTKHGNNKGVKEIICNYPERYIDFQFSVLQILPKTITDEEVIKLESMYKRKMLTKEFGMNNN